jgi:GH15 family glucan-1,4-alpha-glucosidase
MVSYRNKKTGLPKPSYDLWEEKWGTSTFTASTVFGALEVAARFANMLGKAESANKYHEAAQEVKNGIIKYLYDKDEGIFYKHVNFVSGKPVLDKTIDMSSVYGVYKFKVLDYNDPKLKRAFEIFRERLELKTKVGGVARYEGDQYHFHGGDLPGNPWFITTLWLTQYYMEFIGKESDLPDIVKRLSWVVNGTLQSGVLSEQLDPVTGEQLSASPLIWSHAEYVTAVIQYLEKLDELGICKSCYPITL